MVYNLTSSTNIFESLSVLSSFNLAETIWEKYEKFAVPKIEESTLKLRGTLYYLKDISPKEANKELKMLNPIIPILCKLRSMIEPIDDREFHNFKITAMEFFDTVDFFQDNLQDIVSVHSSYEISLPALSEDWNSKEDQHWDNY